MSFPWISAAPTTVFSSALDRVCPGRVKTIRMRSPGSSSTSAPGTAASRERTSGAEPGEMAKWSVVRRSSSSSVLRSFGEGRRSIARAVVWQMPSNRPSPAASRSLARGTTRARERTAFRIVCTAREPSHGGRGRGLIPRYAPPAWSTTRPRRVSRGFSTREPATSRMNRSSSPRRFRSEIPWPGATLVTSQTDTRAAPCASIQASSPGVSLRPSSRSRSFRGGNPSGPGKWCAAKAEKKPASGTGIPIAPRASTTSNLPPQRRSARRSIRSVRRSSMPCTAARTARRRSSSRAGPFARSSSSARWHFLYLRALPHGHGAFRGVRRRTRTGSTSAAGDAPPVPPERHHRDERPERGGEQADVGRGGQLHVSAADGERDREAPLAVGVLHGLGGEPGFVAEGDRDRGDLLDLVEAVLVDEPRHAGDRASLRIEGHAELLAKPILVVASEDRLRRPVVAQGRVDEPIPFGELEGAGPEGVEQGEV